MWLILIWNIYIFFVTGQCWTPKCIAISLLYFRLVYLRIFFFTFIPGKWSLLVVFSFSVVTIFISLPLSRLPSTIIYIYIWLNTTAGLEKIQIVMLPIISQKSAGKLWFVLLGKRWSAHAQNPVISVNSVYAYIVGDFDSAKSLIGWYFKPDCS